MLLMAHNLLIGWRRLSGHSCRRIFMTNEAFKINYKQLLSPRAGAYRFYLLTHVAQSRRRHRRRARPNETDTDASSRARTHTRQRAIEAIRTGARAHLNINSSTGAPAHDGARTRGN